ncbi:hypothetical protein IAT38_001532 [Cryptococcus sp. DSM 104549]
MSSRRAMLLICDVQERFRGAIYGFDVMTSMICKVVKASQLLEVPVLVTEQNPKALGPTISEISALLDGKPTLGNFPKTKFSMVTEDTLKNVDFKSYDSYILTGIESHVCVLQTALDLLKLEHRPKVFILADAVSSCNKQEIPIALDLLRQAGGIVTTSESMIFQLMGDSKNEKFRAVSGLIKEEKERTAGALKALL